MYRQGDIQRIEGQIRTRWAWWAVVAAALLGGLIVSLVIRVEWLTVVLTILLGSAMLFGYDLLIKPLLRYRTHLRFVLGDSLRTMEGDYISHSTEESLIDGIRCTSLLVTDVDAEGEPCERLFYFDRELPFPDLAPGTPLRIRYYDRTVADMAVL